MEPFSIAGVKDEYPAARTIDPADVPDDEIKTSPPSPKEPVPELIINFPPKIPCPAEISVSPPFEVLLSPAVILIPAPTFDDDPACKTISPAVDKSLRPVTTRISPLDDVRVDPLEINTSPDNELAGVEDKPKSEALDTKTFPPNSPIPDSTMTDPPTRPTPPEASKDPPSSSGLLDPTAMDISPAFPNTESPVAIDNAPVDRTSEDRDPIRTDPLEPLKISTSPYDSPSEEPPPRIVTEAPMEEPDSPKPPSIDTEPPDKPPFTNTLPPSPTLEE
jgi:hypothetical protein